MTKKEKKGGGKGKIALERIYRLLELAEANDEYSKRYVQLAKRIGEKYNARMPRELKEKFCKKCFSVNVERTEKKPFLIVKCAECGYEKKFGTKEKVVK